MKPIESITKQVIKENLRVFKSGFSGLKKDDGRQPDARYASFDYCFNYFQGVRNKKDLVINMQESCLHLAFYLASWGMLRGASFLLNKSIKYYEGLITYIASKESDFWKIDVSNYSERNVEQLIKCSDEIRKILSNRGQYRVSNTLTTKIMLGVFGNVPAFDRYFREGSGLGTFNKKALRQISDFYKRDNLGEVISAEAEKIKTFEFDGTKGTRSYTGAKVIDMIFFVEGYKSEVKKN